MMLQQKQTISTHSQGSCGFSGCKTLIGYCWFWMVCCSWVVVAAAAAQGGKVHVSVLPIVAGTITALLLGALAVFVWLSCRRKKRAWRFPDATQELDGN